MDNVGRVQAVYEAFGRGDMPTILGHLSPSIVWDYANVDAGVPWIRPGRGHGDVARFFSALAAELEFTHFVPKALLAADNLVVALLDVSFVVKRTGRVVNEVDEVHVWTFDGEGKVTRFTHRADTYAQWAAFTDAPASQP